MRRAVCSRCDAYMFVERLCDKNEKFFKKNEKKINASAPGNHEGGREV